MNNINIALDVEDRIRIDKLNTNLTILNAALGAVIGHLEGINAANEKKGLITTEEVEEVIHVPGQVSIDEETAQEPQEAHEPVEDVQPLPITVTVKDEPTVTKQDIQQKVIELVGKGWKAAVRDIITTYADNVSGLPDSTLVEVWDKLTALEG
ncbi:MAG: hypothetical protein J6V15_03925 [Clostridia bacterium]|nr:hypothetical protein [Clostridia bacterium]